jgi:hypothetical protein
MDKYTKAVLAVVGCCLILTGCATSYERIQSVESKFVKLNQVLVFPADKRGDGPVYAKDSVHLLVELAEGKQAILLSRSERAVINSGAVVPSAVGALFLPVATLGPKPALLVDDRLCVVASGLAGEHLFDDGQTFEFLGEKNWRPNEVCFTAFDQ